MIRPTAAGQPVCVHSGLEYSGEICPRGHYGGGENLMGGEIVYWTVRRRLSDFATRLSVLRDLDRPQPGKSHYRDSDGKHMDGYVTFGAERHQFECQPLQHEQVIALEQAMGVRLPEQFREFLSSIGTGAGPYYGIEPYETLLECARPACARPFPWAEDDTFWLDEFSESDPDGCLPIVSYGCGTIVALITAGAHRGRVVYLGLDFACVPGPDFLTFYDKWLNESLAELESGERS
ncbi:SMI1 / KNR4 family (SUKH-1) [Actinokineospora diospyrosa]|uniref:SMI1 / KNR4 family (SUKH-1) n=2 Tax=Actinokineospora diospyrosa TaxID=103728 RepID=A0ABT1INA2_9PSEU|nr:SMI1 / KNR4 family (SUKH-1) [Actinokineospora diospyrosa]